MVPPTAVTEATFELDRATELRPTSDPGTFAFDVDPGFTVGPKPNGGYLTAVAARAAGEALAAAGSAHRHALAVTAHFVRAPDPGRASVSVDVLRTGRSASQVRATIDQDGARCVDLTLTVGTLPEPGSPATWQGVSAPEVAAIEDCHRLPPNPPGGQFTVSIMERSDVRLDPATMQWALGAASGRGELRGWISLADGRPTDHLALLFFLDALPPATFDIARSGWVPTLSLSSYLRALPAPGPLRVVQRAQVIADGRVDEVCELWDQTGALIAHATQLAAIRLGQDPVPHPDRSA